MAIFGRVQLKKLPKWVKLRQQHAVLLTECFLRVPGLRVTVPPPEIGHAYYKYYTFVRPERLKSGWNRDRIMKAIISEGVPCFSGVCSEIYLEKAFNHVARRPVKRLKVAMELGETSLMFLVHPTLLKSDMGNTCRVVEKALKIAYK